MGDFLWLQDVFVEVLGKDPSTLPSILDLISLSVFTPVKMLVPPSGLSQTVLHGYFSQILK